MQLSGPRRSNRGFTLIEILLVLALLSLIFTFLGRRIFNQFSRGNVQATKIMIKQLEGNLDRFRLDCGFYPTTDQGLRSLIEAPTGGRQCRNYDPSGYLDGKTKKLPTDAWGSEFKYQCDDGQNYTITSLGADNAEGGEGENKDLSNAEE